MLHRDAEPTLGRVLPAGSDPAAASLAAATLDAVARIDDLLRRIAADATDPSWSPAPAALSRLHDELERTWLAWRLEQRRGA